MSAKKTSGRKPRDDKRQAPVRISVHEANGTPYRKEAVVELIAGKTAIQLRRAKGSGLYEAGVAPGTYALRVKAGTLVSPSRSVSVPAGGKTASAYLGKRDWPVYRYGENVIPFEPRPDLIAVCFETRKPDPKRARGLIDEIVKKLKIKPAAPDSKDEAHPAMAAAGAIWVFEMPARSDRNKVEAELRKMLGADVRIGMPIDLAPQQVKVLDRRFIVRFRDHVKPQEIAALAERAKARIVRGFIQAGNARMIEFIGGAYQDHLAAIEEWYKRELLVYGEPDLLAEMVDDVFPADPPNDPTFGNQLNLTLQNVDDAWQFLNAIDPALTLGSPDVHVATFDRGVQVAHPDIGGNLTDGTTQLAQCFDFNNIRACTDPAYATETGHGMGVYGIIAARADNGNDIAGIAPNTHQLGLLRSGLESANYADMLLWAAGFDTGNPTAGWPAEPISPAADILSCSHGANGLALSGIMDDTLTFLTVYGRGGKGALTIYSAGNSGNLITGFRVWAAHPRTMGIANSDQPDGMGIERRHDQPGVDTSSFGPEIDICAQGHGAPSLNPTGGEQTFGGTSAAAPTVAAAAALMLSAEPALTWINLRDILRDTAVVIDGANVDPVGQWVAGFSQWYGFGRLDVGAAVQGADAFDPGAVSLVIRDNLADTGEFVPTAGTFWRSPDLWVRRSDPATDPIGDPAYDANPPNEAADSGVDNWIRVRVRNVGTAASGNAFVRVYLTHYAGAQFVYPNDYIPTINAGDPLPSPLVQGTYQIGEQMIASLGAGADTILDFLWPSAMVPPEEVAGANWHPCLLAEVSPHTGPDPTGNLVIDNSNLAQRNVTIDYSDDDGAAREMIGVIGNEQNDDRSIRVVVQRGKLPKRAKLWLRFLDPKVERAVLKQLSKEAGDPTTGKPTTGDGHGCCCGPQRRPGKRDTVRVETVAGGRRFCLRAGTRLTLDVPMVGGNLTAVALGVQIPKGELRGTYEVPLIQEDLHGRRTGAFSFEIVRR